MAAFWVAEDPGEPAAFGDIRRHGHAAFDQDDHGTVDYKNSLHHFGRVEGLRGEIDGTIEHCHSSRRLA